VLATYCKRSTLRVDASIPLLEKNNVSDDASVNGGKCHIVPRDRCHQSFDALFLIHH